MTKSGLWQFSTWSTKNAHCATCAFSRYARFSQIRSQINKKMIVILPMEHLAVVVVCQTTQIWSRHSWFRSLDPEFHLSQGNVLQSLYLQSYYNLATLQPKAYWHSATMLVILTISHYNMSNHCKLRLAPLMISVTLMWYSRNLWPNDNISSYTVIP